MKRVLIQSSQETAVKGPDDPAYNLLLDIPDESAIVVHEVHPLDESQALVTVSVVSQMFYDEAEEGGVEFAA